MDDFTRQAFLEWQGRRTALRRTVWVHAVLWASVNLLLFTVWLVTGADFPWFLFPLMGWLVGLTVHGAGVYLLRGPDDALFLQEARRRRLEQ